MVRNISSYTGQRQHGLFYIPEK
jgi:hypothetical protein